MGSVRARKMARSSVKKATRRTKDKQREANIRGNAIIAENWDYSQTLAQNYKRLGLKSKLGTAAGGQEADLSSKIMKKSLVRAQTIADMDSDDEDVDDAASGADFINPEELNSDGEFDEAKIPAGEARIKRDSDGQVVKVIYGSKKFDIDESVEVLKKAEQNKNAQKNKAETQVVQQLEEYANRPIVRHERVESEREDEWLEKLYKKHGSNYKKMFFDSKLNIYQQSEGDLKKRVEKWKARKGLN
ncbi:hypothetical protein ACO0QE_000173 [Hanseniaspora vineae]